VGGIFTVAGVAKLADTTGFYVALSGYALVPKWSLAGLVATVPWIELGLGVLLLVGSLVVEACVACAALLLAFFVGMAYNLAAGILTPCGCFFGMEPIGFLSLARDLVLLALVGFAAWLEVRARRSRRVSQPAPGAPRRVRAATLLSVLSVLVIAVAGTCWSYAGFSAHGPAVVADSASNGVRYWLGPEDARVTIVEFGALDCPECRRVFDYVSRSLQSYPGLVRFAFRHYPFPDSPESLELAKMMEAAGRQGQFWEAYAWAFGRQPDAATALSDWLGGKVVEPGLAGLSPARLQEDMASTVVEGCVMRDIVAAKRLGLNSAPGLVINGVVYHGLAGYEGLELVIKQWLGQAPGSGG